MSTISVASFLGPTGIRRIASDMRSVTRFPVARFVRLATRNIESLSLFRRADHLAAVLNDVLSEPFPRTVRLLVEASGPPRTDPGYGPMENFRLLAFTRLIGMRGADHMSDSMWGLKQLTKRFTAEFDVRPFLIGAESETLRAALSWAEDDDFHVRRLASEGTRSRLPWGVHLKSFQHDPRKALAVIEKLKQDTSRYVQVSVANNLADIIKDDPQIGLSVAEHWTETSHPVTLKIVSHAVRHPARLGLPRAIALRAQGSSRPAGQSRRSRGSGHGHRPPPC
jgi:3-methyladenine DNA glycosylase AlkC